MFDVIIVEDVKKKKGIRKSNLVSYSLFHVKKNLWLGGEALNLQVKMFLQPLPIAES